MNCKISSNKNDLQKLHEKYNWIPGENNIRPTNENINKKDILIQKRLKNFMNQ